MKNTLILIYPLD